MKKPIHFDMYAAVKALRKGKDLSGQDGILTPLIKQYYTDGRATQRGINSFRHVSPK